MGLNGFNFDCFRKWCVNRLINIIVVVAFLVFVVIIIFAASIGSNSPSIIASSNSILSTKKIGWGIKRNSNHEQPELDNSSLELLNRYGGIAIGNESNPYLYLTFDMGYEAGYTEKILDTLAENKVKAMFFITGHYLNTQEALVKRMIEDGHIVGNHTVNHKSLPSLSEAEIEKEIMDLHKALFDKFGYEMEYFRKLSFGLLLMMIGMKTIKDEKNMGNQKF